MKTFYNLRTVFSLGKKLAHLAQCLAVLAIIVWPSSRLFAQAPTISYSTPQSYQVGTTISPLAPSSSGVAAWGYSSSPVPLGLSPGSFLDAVVDAAGNVYTVNTGTSQVLKIPAGGGAPVVLGFGFNSPQGIAVDAAGNVYVADSGNNAVKEIFPDGEVRTLSNVFNNPSAVAVDGAGNVYVADTGNGAIEEIPLGSPTTTLIKSGFANIHGIAVDVAGNIYAADEGATSGALYKIPAGGGAMVPLGAALNRPSGVATDAAGNLYVSDLGYASIIVIQPDGTQFLIGSGLDFPFGVALDGAGNVYVADSGNGLVKEIKINGGYFLSPFLPAGLTFNNSTGIISGTTAAPGAATYTVTAWNSAGSATALVNIKVGAPQISYSGPVAYATGAATTPLLPSSAGPQVTGLGFNNATAVSTGLTDATCLAMDKAGNIYIGESSGQVSVLAPGSSSATVYGTGFAIQTSSLILTEGIAVDASGNVYFADTKSVWKIPPGGGANTAVALGSFTVPSGVALDPSGNIYVADDAGIYKMAADGTGQTTIDNTANGGVVAVDLNGNIFCADATPNLYEILAGGTRKILRGFFGLIGGLATDPSGNVYASNLESPGINYLYIFPASGGLITNEIFSYSVLSLGLMVDPNFNVYMAKFGAGVSKSSPAGGYFISSELPNGLTINSSSGAISGTPTTTSPATNYTVTAFSNSVSGTAAVNIATGPAPVISYGTPQTYQVGSAITPLAPTSSGVATWGYSSTTATIASGFSLLTGVAADAAGNVYTVDEEGANPVEKFPAGGGAPVVLGSGFYLPTGIAVDAAGNVYIADAGNHAVKEIPAGSTGTVNTIGSGFSEPKELAVDGAGNVYVADLFSESVKEIQAGSGATVTLQSGFISIRGVAVDAAGNIYIADAGETTGVPNGAVYKLPAGGGAMVSVGTVPSRPIAVAADAAGNLYVSNAATGPIIVIEPDGTQFTIGSGFEGPDGIALDGAGNVYITDLNAVEDVKITGGYFLSPFLPAGLTFNNSTGVIGGTPAAASPAANYTVTAYNVGVGSMATVNITVSPLPPVISYSTPQSYQVGTAITPLAPSSSGVAAWGYSSTTATIASGFNDLVDVAADAAGNVYTMDGGTALVEKIPAGGGTPVVLSLYLAEPRGIAVDAAGNIYVADTDNNAVKEIPAGSSTVSATWSTLARPTAVAVDGAGNLYVASSSLGSVIEIQAGSGARVTLQSGFSNIDGVAVDAAGNIYVADQGVSSGALYKIPAGGGTMVSIGTGLSQPSGVAVDAAGNLYVSDLNNGSIIVIEPDGTQFTIGSGFARPHGVALDGAGNVYLGDTGNSAVKEVKINGGYFLSPFLPAGLTFSNNTGVISGTPVAASPAANYTVTAYNAGVGATATVNITVGAPVISYSSPQTYTVGAAITPLLPSTTGSAVAGLGFNTATVVSTGLTDATCIARGPDGSIYIGESSGQVSVLAPGATTATVFATGFATAGGSAPQGGIAVDVSGNVYFADGISLWKIPPGGSSKATLGSFATPEGVALDPSGNIYVADGAGVYKMAADGTGQTKIDGSSAGVVAVDLNGNVFFADIAANLFELPAGGTKKLLHNFGSYNIAVLATDPSGNVYVAQPTFGNLYMLPASGGLISYSFFGGGVLGLTVDPNFNLYAAISGAGISKTNATGGYFVSPELPQGLTINPNSGAISGTPTAVSPATNYTVTAFSGPVSGTAAVNITVNAAPPVISYATPQVFVQNTAISPLAPVSAYVATPGYLSTATTAGSFSQPYATAVDESGDVYVADKTANGIYELLAAGGQVTVGTGLNTPVAVAVDKLGNVYTANQGDNTVVEIQAHTGTQTFIGSGYQRPTAVAVDSSGNVFVADVHGASGVVYKISPGQNKVLFKSGFISPNGIAIDAAGNVYVSDFGGGPTASMVYKISPDGSTETPINHSFSTATGLAIDATGNLFIADAGNTDIVEYPAGGGSAMTLTAGLTFPFGLSADAAGNLYIADPGAGQVVKLTPAGGYFINRVLPAGLSFNTTTGTVSGTPATASPATNYTVTAYSSLGSGTAALNIKVNTSPSDATLSGLALSNGTLSPGFAPGTTGYNIAVGNGLSTMTVTPTADNPNATITVQGQTVASGTPSQYLTLATGITSVPVVVTSFDHSTTKTYTLNIKEAKSQNANLTSLKRSSGILIPGFTADGTTYTENVDNGTATMSVIPTAANANATITVNGTTVASGSPSPTYNLPAGGSKVITIMVTAQMGNTKTYTLTVNRALSSDASLSALTISGGTLAPKFEPLTQLDAYAAKVNSSVAAIEVTPTATNANIQSITVNTAAVSSGSPSGPITLSTATTPITIVVTAQDGTQRTYTVTITRVINDASLSNLQVDAGTFTPKFQPLTSLNTYSANEANGTNSVNVTPTTTDPGATITINTNTAISGQPTAITISIGTNLVTIVVTASDGSTTRTYKLSINVAAPPADNTAYQPVSVEKPADDPTLANDGIMVHQAISPNGDGINDFLQIDNISQYPDNKLSIMNRNGQLIYQASGYDNSSKIFDGHSNKNGQMQLPGTYFYQLDYTVNGLTKHKTGFLVLKY